MRAKNNIECLPTDWELDFDLLRLLRRVSYSQWPNSRYSKKYFAPPRLSRLYLGTYFTELQAYKLLMARGQLKEACGRVSEELHAFCGSESF
jgi:hypothetical protein